jgi:SAM-dependent MidA family methyltransferase
MADALRAARKVPGFLDALDVVLVEPNAALQAVQRQTLAGATAPVRWVADIADVDAASGVASILIANEVLDVLPVRQFQRTENGWAERGIGINDAGELVFGIASEMRSPSHQVGAAQPGEIVEERSTGHFSENLRRLAAAGPLASLFIDYGYEGPAIGDTLQAVRGQRYEDPLAAPGLADLTAHVDFTAFGADVRTRGLAVDGPVPQAAFLGALGIVERTSHLMAANPEAAPALEAATARITAPTGMGTLFKVIGVRSNELPSLPGL